jgi:diacylglycerol O-acyltransferase
MRLSDHDASFLYTETASGPMHTAAIFVLDGEVPLETIVAHFKARMHLVPRYLQKLAFVPFNLAHPKWVDDPEFDLDNHVVRHSVPAGASLEEAVDELLVINEQLLDRTKPLWKTYVVDGVPGKTLLLQQVHHCMIDGVSGVELTMILLDFEPDAAPPPPPKEPWRPDPLPTPLELVTEALRENAESLADRVTHPPPTDGKALSLLQNAGRTMTRFFTDPVILAPWNAGLVGPKRKMRWSIHDFSEFREIRRAFGGTINDVVLAAVSEGAARYLAGHGEDTEGRRLRIMCPVSVRTEGEQGALGNRVSGIFPLLPAWPMEVRERLEVVRGETERIKANEEAQALTLMNERSPSIPPVAMAPTLLVGTAFDPTALAARFPAPTAPRLGTRPPHFGFNFTCTNVPGVQVPLYLAGHQLESMIGILMLTGSLGYGVAVGSYNQEMVFSFIGESRLMPDLEAMTEAVDGAFAELLELARKVNVPPEPVKLETPKAARTKKKQARNPGQTGTEGSGAGDKDSSAA